jgi:hypothetical protein
VGQTGAGDDKGPARVDLLHQVEALERQVAHRRKVDRAGVVDYRVYPAEALDRLGNRPFDGLGVADVAHDGQSLAAGGLDLVGGRVDRAG